MDQSLDDLVKADKSLKGRGHKGNKLGKRKAPGGEFKRHEGGGRGRGGFRSDRGGRGGRI